MHMPLPDNTLPMMSGAGPFGPIEMGGMFTVMKVRDGLAPGDYSDPGWYKHPTGTVAYEVAAAEAGEPHPHDPSPEPETPANGHEHH
jgi:manganese oxidase